MRKLRVGSNANIRGARKTLRDALLTIHAFVGSDGQQPVYKAFSMTDAFATYGTLADRVHITAILKRCGLILKYGNATTFAPVNWFVRPVSALDDLPANILRGVIAECAEGWRVKERLRKLEKPQHIAQPEPEPVEESGVTTVYVPGKIPSAEWFRMVEERTLKLTKERDDAYETIRNLSNQIVSSSPVTSPMRTPKSVHSLVKQPVTTRTVSRRRQN